MTGRFEKQYGSYLTYIAEWSATSNVAGNYSTVIVDLYLRHKAISLSPKAISCTVNGQTQKGNSPQLSQSSTSYYTTSKLSSFSFKVNHKTDGTMSCAFSSNWDCKITYSGKYYGTMTLSGTITGDNIPRASSISSITPSVVVNGTNKVNISISRAVSSFTHSVTFSIGDKTKVINNVQTSTSFAIPMDWLEKIPNAAKGTAWCNLRTYNGGTQVGDVVTKTFEIVCPDNILPTMDTPTAERINNSVPAAWNMYLQNVSGVKISAQNARGVYGSTIKEYAISCAGFSTTSNSLTIQKIPNSGTVEYSVTAKDSRGRTVTKKGTITVNQYDSPVVSSLSAFRCDASGHKLEKGTYLSVTANVTFTVINGQNVPEITCYVNEQGGGAVYTQILENGKAKIIPNISTDRAYDIRVTAIDMFSSGERFSMISTTRYYMHFKRGGGLGVAFGKAAEKDGVVEFDDNIAVEINGNGTYKGHELASIEYGTWTPRLSSREGSTVPTYTESYCHAQYYKIGKLVYIAFHMKVNITNAGDGYATVEGLPFQSNDKSDGFGLSVRETAGALEEHPSRALIQGASTRIWIQRATGANANKYKTGELYIGFSGCYIAK